METKKSDGARVNPEIDQDRAADLYECWTRYGYLMFPQQRSIYRHLADRCAWKNVLEAGCGDGIGGAQIAYRAKRFVGTDKLACNVHFARCLYPWLTWDVWNLAHPWHGNSAECVVCVEAFEHVADPERTLRHLLAACTGTMWLSTPNGAVKQEYPPSNPFHVQELEPHEILALLEGYRTTILHWETFEPLTVDTEVNPLVYKVDVRQ